MWQAAIRGTGLAALVRCPDLLSLGSKPQAKAQATNFVVAAPQVKNDSGTIRRSPVRVGASVDPKCTSSVAIVAREPQRQTPSHAVRQKSKLF